VSRRFRNSVQLSPIIIAFITTVVLMAILVFGALISMKIYKRIDLTITKRHSLSEQTIKALGALREDIKAVGFYTPAHNEKEKTVSLLKLFSDTSERFNFEIVNPERNPGRTRRYGKIVTGTVVVESGVRWEKVNKPDETSLLNAILRISHEEKKNIFFIQGHGEKDPEDEGTSGLRRAHYVLDSLGYNIFGLNLIKTSKVPPEANITVIAGPKKDFFIEELKGLEFYLNEGGALLVLVDPHNLPNFSLFIRSLGVVLGRGVIVDKSKRLSGSDMVVTIVDQYSTHEIAGEVEAVSLFPLSRSVEPMGLKNPDIALSPIARTDDAAWEETDIAALFGRGIAEYDDLNDRRGPVTIALAGEFRSTGARFVIIGDSDFATNAYFDQGANGDIFVNSVLWLNREKDLIASRPIDREFYPIVLTNQQLTFLFWIVVVLLPAATLVTGVLVIRRVRWRG